MLRISAGCGYPGIMSEIIGYIGRKGGYEIVPYVGRNGDGNRQTLQQALGDYENVTSELVLNGTVDTLAFPILKTGELLRGFEYSHHIYRIRSSLIIYRHDDFGTSYWNLFSMYDELIWQVLGWSLLLQCAFGMFVRYAERTNGIQGDDSVGNFFQAEPFLFHYRAGNLSLLIFSLLQCTVVFGIFASYFLSAMLNPKQDLSYANMDQILRDIRTGKRDIVLLSPGSWFEERVMNGTGGLFRELKAALAGRKMLIEGDHERALHLLSEHNAILFFREDDAIASTIFSHCEYLQLNVDLPKLDVHFIFAKNWSGLHDFSALINDNIRKIYNIKRRYIEGGRRKPKVCSHFKVGDPMKLVFYVGVLIVAGVLILTAAFLLALEVIVNRLRGKPLIRTVRTHVTTEVLKLQFLWKANRKINRC
ncbi:unnamed protein product [Bursaphelenchus xylophilus]|uniref:(pine wood nematode) hypothetical protein n=1 Tax=Bursaphelenchus xylophilus TaxID=6326 RepID=A0A1I7SD45_BURXY|nr:unnamed protein product [Bursaphelenchus xylophilus]CAG9092946.1 unnamed protein product [Bursaphelenchus xylophilus]